MHSELRVRSDKVIIYSISAKSFLKLTPSCAKCTLSCLNVHLEPVPIGPLSSLSIGDYLLTEVFVKCMNLLFRVD